MFGQFAFTLSARAVPAVLTAPTAVAALAALAALALGLLTKVVAVPWR